MDRKVSKTGWLLPLYASLVFALAACGQPRSLEPVSDDAVILAFGDSLTYGYGVRTEQSYPAVLQSLMGRKVVNSGISGETSAEAVERFELVLAEVNPELVILCTGGNDILRKISSAQTKANLENLVEMAQARNIQVVLVGVPELGIFSDTADYYFEVAEAYQVPIEGEIIVDLERSPSDKSDAVHFNESGYRKMAEAIYDLLEESGAL